ncbi:lysosome membrane protein 2-like isoform X2 [Xenia sp. Carnegie-2017]|uniref:lysosome membrane protein 2-like isoform X2 n=1 Tax=Xenia sp. Carnegie-2017 TaxID=2897299 RepID=UPI001F04DE76|nr:lysosome membrane protein 2-like isoform X2 [Xenia sp. Carnegie-2017]
MKACNCKICSFLLVCFGFALTISATVCILFNCFDDLIKNTIVKNVQLKNGTEAFKNWKSPSSDVYMQFFMFNLTNAKNVSDGKKPSVKQVGPYSYREIRKNVPRFFNHESNTLAYFSQKAYVFDKATSCAGCDPVKDKFVTINIPLLKLSELVKKGVDSLPHGLAILLLPLLNQFFGKEDVFRARSVSDLLWGYDDFILSRFHNFTVELNKQLKNHTLPFHVPIINSLVMLQSNNTNTSGEIHTGVGKIDRLGAYVKYNGMSTLPWWHTKWANMINGTDGTIFHPDINKGDHLPIFSSDICRSINIRYHSTVDVEGIPLYRFFAGPEQFKYNADNRAGFCNPDANSCVPDGLLDVSVCKPLNVPVVVSLPHFLFANKTVIDSVNGMHPNEEDHSTFISIEPNTGITMQANKRIQVNVALTNLTGITQFENMRTVFLPVLFVNETAVISKSDADKFKNDVLLPKKLLDIGKYVFIGVGLIIMVLGLILLRVKGRKVRHSETSVQIQNEQVGGSEKSPLMRSVQNYVT